MSSTQLILLASLAFSLFLCELLAKPAIGADREEKVRWRHEGLLIDDRDVAFIKEHLDEEPWKSAMADQLFQNHLLNLVIRKRVTGDDNLNPLLISHLDFSKSGQHPYLGMQKWIGFANAFEVLHKQYIVSGAPRKQWLDWINGNIYKENLHEIGKFWPGIQKLAQGVINEDEALFKQGEEDFISYLGQFDETGQPLEEIDLQQHVNWVNSLVLMAEINAHHGDIFYGNDLYHYSIGHKNLYRICSDLYRRIKTRNVFQNNMGWLEIAYKTYGDPEWLPELKSRRPIFDEWAGGPVTLTHGRVYSDQPPDFGIADDGFHWLYNFKDLTGWQMSARWYDIDPNDFFVEDGVIRTKGARDHWLMTDRMYNRFHLKLEYQIGQGSNSGILIWAPVPGRPSKCGFEVQLMDDAGKAPAKDGSGALYEVFAPTVNAQKPAGEWNTMEIICSDPRLRVFLNGTMVQDINLNDDPKTQGRRRHGFIGLQDHAHKVAFRNVRVKVLEEGEGFE